MGEGKGEMIREEGPVVIVLYDNRERARKDDYNRKTAYFSLTPMEQRVYDILSGIGAEGTQWEDEIQGAKEIVEVFRASVI